MNFVKERNLIVAYDNAIKVGAWNITDGSFIGKKDKPVKSIPDCFTYKYLPDEHDHGLTNNNTILGYAIYKYRKWLGNWYFEYTTARGNRMEQLISVGLLPDEERDLDDKTPLTKELVTYIKENNYGFFKRYAVQDYLNGKKYEDFLNGKPYYIQKIFKRLINDVPYDYLKTMLNRIDHEHVKDFYGCYYNSEIITLISRYYEICMTLYGNVEIKPNILSNYAHLLYLEDEYKKAGYNENLAAHNNKRWLYFENETFIVRPLLTKEEFHEEGERQNNCIERTYMKMVKNKETHVVTVRRITNPDKNYITCEVSNQGKIVQYLARCNRCPSDPDAIAFKQIYQAHLNAAEKE